MFIYHFLYLLTKSSTLPPSINKFFTLMTKIKLITSCSLREGSKKNLTMIKKNIEDEIAGIV